MLRYSTSTSQLDSVAGIATRYSWTVWGSHPCVGQILSIVQTGSGAHPASCIAGCGSFLLVKQPDCGADHTASLLSSSELVPGIPQPTLCPLHRHVTG